ncbi:5-formyltetrahydrofolate cyclo-ligase [Lacticaseibacillus chiayiensis]|uniref:5-formyltetrahydrofolate cyclo-ligase n=1 Tax=Lacticaseibacillus chiayiensis TaxID=2100821 RepID=A0A4Q1TZG3_9LACO|nr:5-formyltetrahydrofolate cyclo-ligase [Lacticaseibacillus chiayiensis]QVI35309.1 5-formyltetrahydrofolate cyclo-ligase [Lacticaseibacillus chiayiensis]RXT23518.1 5-formyltetrahydrofolate cyclo-ligase [Lacticaseibacillus chiayiensis]UYN57090.1 5-formyltetrahydrofolate cyclo-ligase [Lacticaseibacillus chiayiensis]
MSTKAEFRTHQLKRLQAAADETQAASESLMATLFKTSFWQQAKSIGITVSSPFEVATAPIIAAAHAANKAVFLPRVMPKRQMVFLPDPGHKQLVKSAFGIPEPAYQANLVEPAPDLLIVPGIGFSLADKYRIGFGGGYYDRFLAKYPGHTLTLVPPVMAFPQPDWPVERFDVPIETLILANGDII